MNLLHSFLRRSLPLAGVLFAALPRPSHAADAAEPSVVVQPSSTCSAAYVDGALQHALEVELAATPLELVAAADDVASPPRLTLSAECEEEAVSLRVWSSVPRLVVARTVALTDVPEAARARTLALIVREALAPVRADASSSSAPSSSALSSEGELEPSTPRRSRRMPSALLTRDNPYDAGLAPLDPSESSFDPRPIRIGAAAQGRLFLDDDNLLLALEVGASGPLSQTLDWGIEASHIDGKISSVVSALDVDWWNASMGIDFVLARSMLFAIGPRFSLGSLTISDDPTDREHTLVTQLGARTKLDLPLGQQASVQMTTAIQHRLGVLALEADYSGFDRALDGWLLSWGLGLAMAL
jgi:hypothetical protein